jgi:ATP-dependent DNA helicase RecQ
LNEELYNFQIQNPGWDPFIKTLLRSYGGSFENYVRLKEFDLARRTGMNTQQVIQGLQQLQSFNLLSYLPQTDKPQITWLKSRQHANNLYINKVFIDQRKETYRKKMEAVFAYAEHKRCRSQMLLSYFDEPNANKCGVCDVCLEERRQKNAEEIFDDITNEIVQLLSTDTRTIDELMTSLKLGTEKEKIQTIRLLLDAGKIKTDGGNYYL